MYDYQFVRVPITYRSGQIESASYQEVTAQHAREGWRLVQILIENPAAVAAEYVLIFERPIQQP
ncbi:DUF4177 domain-containing protein [Deinococcus ruber]|uniref:DUF4177 domain-containing protein n=1 Tax=Deinococcus ruber TaxID=1848197 RepID=A0A918BWE3_9DEIO|nr:DUF4177 domain-containing protein [Deinococcus ruber]GGQ94241.1 hypothetical protein GCM10008957_02970 [Deinococcus ruber]